MLKQFKKFIWTRLTKPEQANRIYLFICKLTNEEKNRHTHTHTKVAKEFSYVIALMSVWAVFGMSVTLCSKGDYVNKTIGIAELCKCVSRVWPK